MSNNVIIKGFNALSKLIGQGFAQAVQSGDRVCMTLRDRPYTFMEVNDEPYTCMSLSDKSDVSMKVRTEI